MNPPTPANLRDIAQWIRDDAATEDESVRNFAASVAARLSDLVPTAGSPMPTDPTNPQLREAPFYPRMSIRAAGLLISYDGRVPVEKLRNMVKRCGATGRLTRQDGRANGSAASSAVAKAMRPLTRDGLVHREGDEFVAGNLADLADWLTEALETIEERSHG